MTPPGRRGRRALAGRAMTGTTGAWRDTRTDSLDTVLTWTCEEFTGDTNAVSKHASRRPALFHDPGGTDGQVMEPPPPPPGPYSCRPSLTCPVRDAAPTSESNTVPSSYARPSAPGPGPARGRLFGDTWGGSVFHRH